VELQPAQETTSAELPAAEDRRGLPRWWPARSTCFSHALKVKYEYMQASLLCSTATLLRCFVMLKSMSMRQLPSSACRVTVPSAVVRPL